MAHYIDIQLRTDPEFAANQLLMALYAKLHRVLVGVQATGLAVSFPRYRRHPADLGTTMRLIGDQGDLARLMEHRWLTGMTDHVDVAAMAEVPANAEHRHLRRVQAKSSPERLRRRQMRRHGLSAEQARERVPNSAAETLRLPFLGVHSASTGQSFPLFLRLSEPVGRVELGAFNAYGLSTSATIPWF